MVNFKEFTLAAITSLELHLFLVTLKIKGDLLEDNFTESFEENPGPLFKEETILSLMQSTTVSFDTQIPIIFCTYMMDF